MECSCDKRDIPDMFGLVSVCDEVWFFVLHYGDFVLNVLVFNNLYVILEYVLFFCFVFMLIWIRIGDLC